MTEQQKKTLGLAVASLVFGCFFLIPLLGLLFGLAALIMGIIALVRINKNKAQLKGEGMAIAGIVMGALSVLMIPFFALLAAIAIPNLLHARLIANEDMAQATIRTLGSALESYRDVYDSYPLQESSLTQEAPPYMDRTYNGKTVGGYRYSVLLSGDDYEIIAVPETCGASGNTNFKMTGTGGDVQQEPCSASVRRLRR